MKIKLSPDIDGFYWVRIDKNSPFRIVKVMGEYNYLCGDSSSRMNYNYKEWIGPIVPDEIEIFVTKQK